MLVVFVPRFLLGCGGFRPYCPFWDYRRTGFVRGAFALLQGVGVDLRSSKRRNPLVWETMFGVRGGCWIRYYRLMESEQ